MSDRDRENEHEEAQRAAYLHKKGQALASRVKDIAKAKGTDGGKALQRFAAESLLWALTQVQDDRFMVKGGLLWGQTARPTTDADVVFETRKSAAQMHAEMQAAAALLAEHGIRVEVPAVRVLEMGGAGRGLRAPVRVAFGNSNAKTQLDIGFGPFPKTAQQATYTGMFKCPPFPCVRQPWEEAAADRMGAIFQHGMSNTRLKDFRDLYRLRQRGDLDDEAVCRGLVRYFDDRGMDRAQLLKMPDGLSFDFALANKHAWLERIVREDPSLPDFPEVVDEIHHWWLHLRETLVDMASRDEIEDRRVVEAPALVPGYDNVYALPRRARG